MYESDGPRHRISVIISYKDNITAISGLRLSEVVHRSRDREDWRNVVMAYEAATLGIGDGERRIL